MRTRLIAILTVVCLLASGCKDDFVEPAYIHVEGMKVIPSTNEPVSTEEGFYTSEITSLYVIAYYSGSRAQDTLGLFELPFTIPVLHNGEVEYFEFAPAVKQSGVAGTQPYYPFYNRVRREKATLVPGDTVDFDTVATTYAVTRADVLMGEFFEPTEGSLLFDSVVTWHRHAGAEACSGLGYGSVHVDEGQSSVPFTINLDFHVTDPTKIVYLELDTRSDIRFEVYMHASPVTGGVEEQQRVMVVNATDHWQHLYINLGRTWSWFNYPSTFRLSFAALNVEGKSGEVRLDNVKVLTTNHVL